jgi:tRNA-2-methylthio-N6-dimethylallyladenosine synthase
MHLPVQSGSDSQLKRMWRGYTAARYLEIVGRARALVPDIAVTTDLIVGFPGETEEDFQATLALVAAADFDGAYSFKYSPRPGTPGAAMEDQVPEPVKDVRLARLNALLDVHSRRHNDALVGSIHEALVEGAKPAAGSGQRATGAAASWQGRLRNNKLVLFPPVEGVTAGQFARVMITGAGSWTLSGEVPVPLPV